MAKFCKVIDQGRDSWRHWWTFFKHAGSQNFVCSKHVKTLVTSWKSWPNGHARLKPTVWVVEDSTSISYPRSPTNDHQRVWCLDGIQDTQRRRNLLPRPHEVNYNKIKPSSIMPTRPYSTRCDLCDRVTAADRFITMKSRMLCWLAVSAWVHFCW